MVWKQLLEKLNWKKRKVEPQANRFLKFYYEHKKRLLKERKSAYYERKKSGICVRCQRKVVPSIIFCSYHQQKQVGYNEKARGVK